MRGVLPLMTLAPTTSTPDIHVVNKLRDVIATGLKSQKQIGKEKGLSQTLMSQYMSLASRVKGWKGIDELLDGWADDFNELLTKHTLALTERIAEEQARLEPSLQTCVLSDIEYQVNISDNDTSSTPHCQEGEDTFVDVPFLEW